MENKDDWVVHNDIYVKPRTKAALKAWETRKKGKKETIQDIRLRIYNISNELMKIAESLMKFDGRDAL